MEIVIIYEHVNNKTTSTYYVPLKFFNEHMEVTDSGNCKFNNMPFDPDFCPYARMISDYCFCHAKNNLRYGHRDPPLSVVGIYNLL